MAFNIRDYGAFGDGECFDTSAIQKAIDACSQAGGGTVAVSPGVYLCGTLQLRSGVTLHLESGSVIRGSADKEQYTCVCATPFSNHPGYIWALIWAEEAEKVAVTGDGAIDGGAPEALTVSESRERDFRPVLVFVRNCRDISFRDVTLRNADFWTLHLLRCDSVRISGIAIRNNPRRINTDGIDPDGCRDVVISDCRMVCGDDCIVIKSTEGDLCSDIAISNCVLESSTAALKVGTEAQNAIRNVNFSNCTTRGRGVALALYMKDGSTYENMLFTNMICESENNLPILVDHTPRDYENPTKGDIRNIVFENVIIRGNGRCLTEGLPDRPVENMVFRNITWNLHRSVDFANARKPGGSRRTNPDPNRIEWAKQPYHFIAVNVNGLILQDFRLYEEPEKEADRGSVFLYGVREAQLSGLKHCTPPPGIDTVKFEKCADVTKA